LTNGLLVSLSIAVGLSCLLHVGLVGGLFFGARWVGKEIASRPPVLPVELVTVDARSDAPRPVVTPPPRERFKLPKLLRPSRPPEPPAPAVQEPLALRAPATTETALASAAPSESPAAAVSSPDMPAAVKSDAPAAPPMAVVTGRIPDVKEAISQYAHPRGGYQVRPGYPEAPRRLGIQGTTLLRVHVLADGQIGQVVVEKSAGHADLDQAAADAVRRWRFEPARRGAEPVAMWVLLPVEFRLR
jgi:protein TonB